MSTHQQAQAGTNARIIQIFGDNNIVGDRPHLTIHCPQQERPSITVPAQDEAALLRPGAEAAEFAGRSDILNDFVRWAQTHDPKRPVSVRVVHGGAGVGKTRFALELCRALGPDWQAGFVPGKEPQRAQPRGVGVAQAHSDCVRLCPFPGRNAARLVGRTVRRDAARPSAAHPAAGAAVRSALH